MELWMFRQIRTSGWWVALVVLMGLHLTPSLAHADCVELKNDTFDEQKQTPVVAIRSFCISENYGTIFTATQDLVLQKLRVLISGDGQRVMNQTALRVSIYKEKGPASAEPGEFLFKEGEYSPPATISQPTPQWLEITDIKVSVKKGDRFRVTVAHANINCELRAPEGKPLCAEVCQWWSATTDNAATKPKTNVISGNLFSCPSVTERKWRFWEEVPAECRPKGNLILRVFGATASGQDCLGGGVGPTGCTPNTTQNCACPNNQTSTQTCSATGQWGPCNCGTGNNNNNNTNTNGNGCTPGASVECACPGGKKGAQNCNSSGTGFDACQCGGGSAPVITQITPDKGPVNQNIPITVIGENFEEGAKVIIGVVAANDVKVLGPTSITATVPAAIKSGEYDVIVENPDGKRGTLRSGFLIEGGCGCTTLNSPGQVPLSGGIWVLFVIFLFLKKRRYA